MKRILIALLLVTISSSLYAKKVKFACDMTGTPVLPTGMHISGDFQTLAGFPGGDWNSGSTPLTQEPGTEIYSIIVDIPAFAKYEYKFVNGDQFYEAEFVPEFSRVGYNFNDNRWIYIDSLANDTTFVGAILFAANAPDGLFLARFFVDMNSLSVSTNGVHIAGSFQGWDPASTILYSFGNNVYEIIAYVSSGSHEYKFYNGNTAGSSEMVPVGCEINGNREYNVIEDVLIGQVCYASCDPCLTGIAENNNKLHLNLFPNPASQNTKLNLDQPFTDGTVVLYDLAGRVVREYSTLTENSIVIERGTLNKGLYFVSVANKNGANATAKLIFE